jgi:2-iminoacetate synthase ThiH
MDAEEVERHIRDAGFAPMRRNMRYERVGAA